VRRQARCKTVQNIMLTASTKHCKAFFPCIIIGSHIETRVPAELVKFEAYGVPDTKLHHEVMCRNGGIIPHILNSSPDDGECSDPRPPPHQGNSPQYPLGR